MIMPRVFSKILLSEADICLSEFAILLKTLLSSNNFTWFRRAYERCMTIFAAMLALSYAAA